MNEELIREVSKIALEHAMETVAKQAEAMARIIPSEMRGPEALTAFAAAIRSTIHKTWPTKGGDNHPGKAKGGYARADALSPERRTEIAKGAANKRWKGH